MNTDRITGYVDTLFALVNQGKSLLFVKSFDYAQGLVDAISGSGNTYRIMWEPTAEEVFRGAKESDGWMQICKVER